jgi:hypothetical protein
MIWSAAALLLEGVSLQTRALSENAVALLRFRVKKWPMKFRAGDLSAYQELVHAGIMAPDGDDSRFGEEG